MIGAEEWNAIRARRTLLRQQTTLLGPRLPWLEDSRLIPDHAVDPSVAPDDVQLAAFSLAAWMLIDLVQAGDKIYQALNWGYAFEKFDVAPQLQPSVARAVLCPAARHAPGLFAIAEIVAVIPMVASRAGVARARWLEIARRSQAFGSMLAHDGTAVQVLIRKYLSRAGEPSDPRALRSLNPAWLRLDAEGGLTTVTPLDDVLNAARNAAARHDKAYHATCVALQAPAPENIRGPGMTTMFGAIWSRFAEAADRLAFPRFEPAQSPARLEVGSDPNCAEILDRLATNWDAELSDAASHPYPPSVERILGNLLLKAQGSPAR